MLLGHGAILLCVSLAGGTLVARLLRRQRLTWSWGLIGVPVGYLVFQFDRVGGVGVVGVAVMASGVGARWHRDDLHHGVDYAEAASRRISPVTVAVRLWHRRRLSASGWVSRGQLIVGTDSRGLPVKIPTGDESGKHTLVVGATGSGKTVSETWITVRLIEQGHGAIVIDPKGDPLLHRQLEQTAKAHGRRFLQWSPEGPCAYNPYGRGGDTELTDKALAGEVFTEPHYLRQAQRYLGHAVRAMHAAEIPVTPVSLLPQLDPRELEVTARGLPEEQGQVVERYLDGLTDRQKRDLAGVRDRLSILAESDTARWLTPTGDAAPIDLFDAVRERAVVYFRLDADRRPLLSQMLGAAIGAAQVARLFGRARSAGISLVLGTQELADLKVAGEGLKEQVLGNVSSLIAHRQNVPESAELIAAMAGSRPTWITTHQTEETVFGHGRAGRGSKRRGYEYTLHPAHIKQLPTGCAAVIVPGAGPVPVAARMRHP